MTQRGADVDDFRRDGFVLVRAALDEHSVADLVTTISAARGRDPGPNPLSSGAMQFASNLYRAEPDLQRFLTSDPIVDLVTRLCSPDAWVRWDQAVWKAQGAGSFPWHQDNGYTDLATEHLQVWVALTPMGRHNGGLAVIPGGHRTRLTHWWSGSHREAAPEGSATPIDAAPGDVVAFSSFLPHCTVPHVAGPERLAYVAEFLPLRVADPSVPPPHFVACRRGRADGSFCDLTGSWATTGR